MNRERLVLVLFVGSRRGIRLGRTNREVGFGPQWLNIATLADWEMELLTSRKRGPIFTW
ncbi:hypothetical protein [Microbacterium sp. 69-10]|uniref:hypothetical protein n=1 Tax=Microbacterium sp. 69-10 TaxID=1895783 RepID=UPI0025D61223|nr:hypothetical protein [Microbacterium sp. 69-10]